MQVPGIVKAYSTKDKLRGDPCGIRTRDLLDENQISWTTRRRGRLGSDYITTSVSGRLPPLGDVEAPISIRALHSTPETPIIYMSNMYRDRLTESNRWSWQTMSGAF